MTLLFNIIFIITSILLGVGAVMLIVRNIIDINKLNNPKTILKDLHPELENVQTGDELMTVNFGEEKRIKILYINLLRIVLMSLMMSWTMKMKMRMMMMVVMWW